MKCGGEHGGVDEFHGESVASSNWRCYKYKFTESPQSEGFESLLEAYEQDFLRSAEVKCSSYA